MTKGQKKAPVVCRGLNVCCESVADNDLLHYVPLADLIDHFQAFVYLPEHCVVSVEVSRIVTAMADEELGASGIAAGVGHGEHAPVVVLIVAVQFTVDVVTRSAGACAIRTSALDHKIWNYPVKGQSVVEAMLGQVDKVLYRVGCVVLEEFDLHHTFLRVYFCFFHIWIKD